MHALIRAASCALTVVLGLVLAPALASAAPTRVVLAPVSSLSGESNQGLASIEAILESGLRGTEGLEVIGAKEASKATRKAKRPELRSCEGDTACLVELGALVEAQFSVYAEVGGLGDAQVIYLKLVDVASKREVRSTTMQLSKDQKEENPGLAAATRLLAPDRYVGQLQVSSSVPGAIVYLDGHKIASTPSEAQAVFVGSHALRVTHPEHSDYVRWVDIKFGEKTLIEAELKNLPEVSRKLSAQGIIKEGGTNTQSVLRPTPWYYRWYTITGGAAVVFLGSALIVGSASGGIDADLVKRL